MTMKPRQPSSDLGQFWRIQNDMEDIQGQRPAAIPEGIPIPNFVPTTDDPIAQAPPQEVIVAPPPPRPVISPLDRWSIMTFGKFADELEGNDLYDLTVYTEKLAADDKNFWRDRNHRMEQDQITFELTQPPGTLGDELKTKDEQIGGGNELITLPDPFLYTDKIVNMLSGAGISFHMPSTNLANTQASQKVTNYANWWWREFGDRSTYSGGTDPLRMMAHYGCLRGWITTLILPDSQDDEFPYRVEVEDPIYVYPRFSRSKLPIRVTRQYTMTAMEAKSEYPESFELLNDYKDDDLVQIVAYYDSVYHFIIICGREYPQNGKRDLFTVSRPVQHGVKDMYGNPVIPWVIVVPKGNIGGAKADSVSGSRNSTSLYGPGILYGMHEMYTEMSRLVSMLLTNVAKATDPPTVTMIANGAPAPEPLKLEPGSRNFLVMNQQDVKILDTAPNPGNLQPAITIIEDRLNKATLPSVFWGDSGSIQSGYGVGLLSNAAMDILRPYTKGLEAAIRLILRRMLEITYNVTSETHDSLRFDQHTGILGQTVANVEFDPLIISETGSRLDVKFGEVTPQDKAAAASYIIGLVGAGIVSRYTAREELGYEDPLLEFDRIALESNLQDPAVQAMIGPIAAIASDEELLKKVLQAKQMVDQMRAMQALPPNGAPGDQVNQNGKGQMPNTAVPTAVQNGNPQPESQNPATQAADANAASLMASMGGSQPNPR